MLEVLVLRRLRSGAIFFSLGLLNRELGTLEISLKVIEWRRGRGLKLISDNLEQGKGQQG